MALLTKESFLTTFKAPMQAVSMDAVPPLDFWPYFQSIPIQDFESFDCSAERVENAWRDSTGKFEHVLINSQDKNVFMVIVIDCVSGTVFGHRLLNLNREYGLDA